MQKFKAILFLVMMTFSIFGRGVEVHYCKGELTGNAFFSEEKCCCAHLSETKSDKCHAENKEQHKNTTGDQDENDSSLTTDCCKTAFVDGVKTDDYKSHSVQLKSFAIAIAIFCPSLFQEIQLPVPPMMDYVEPPSWSDLSVDFQTFLI